MVRPFQFSRIPKIHFKNGIISDLPRIIKLYGKKIVLVTGKNSFIGSDSAEKLLNDFEDEDIKYDLIVIPGEPSPEQIDEAVKKFFHEDIKLVVGVGGGSALDAGKAISAMLHRTESVKEYLEGVGNKEHPGSKVPFIAVPTTSGTGSEATKNAVISKVGKDGFKRSIRHDNFVPDIALIDPELTLTCPAGVTIASGMDCFTQLTEAYLSITASEYSDALAFEGIKAVKDSLLKCCSDGEDIEARTGMSFAALTSGICIANAGIGVIHGFSMSLGGRYYIPHGLVCGTLMAVSNEISVRELRRKSVNPEALNKYASLGRLFLDDKDKTDDFYIDGFIDYLHHITNDFQMPGLKEFGIEEKDIQLICSTTENRNNPVKLDVEDLMEILYRRL
jgi:alcohol dehydrogenase class IV